MDKISVIGLDLAKNVFQVHGANAQGKKLLSRRLKRAEVLEFFATLPPLPGGHGSMRRCA